MHDERRPSLRKIAQMLNVSPSTVSRALRNSGRISESTKWRVRQAYLELSGGTYPAFEGTTPTAAVLVSRPLGSLSSDEFFSQVVDGIVTYAEDIGWNLLLTAIDGRQAWRPPRILEEREVEGVIVGGVVLSEEYQAGLAKLPLPVVYIGRHERELSQSAVISDNVQGGRLAAAHLIDSGYDAFAFLGGSVESFVFRDRLEGFRQGLEAEGVRLKAAHVLATRIDRIGGYEGIEELLRRIDPGAHRRLGVFAATDWMAAGAVQYLNERGISTPQDVGIVGYSDLDLASHLSPPLTTLRVDAPSLGHLAMRLLEDLRAGRAPSPTQIWTHPRLIVRGTTAPAPGSACGNVLM